MLRIGVAGVGCLGAIHLKNYLKYKGAAVVALADLDKDRSEGKLSAMGGNLDLLSSDGRSVSDIRSFDDYKKLCDAEDIDVVSVCLPSDLHADAAIRAMRAGKHVFCEKPMALKSRHARKMLDVSEKTGKRLMIGHCLRFWPEYVVAHETFKTGRLGRVIAASFTRSGNMPGRWFAQRARSGGAVVDLHIHDADVCVWWWGKPKRITAGGACIDGSPNVVHSRWTYQDGPVITFESTWEPVPSAPFFYSFKITLEKGTLMLDSRNSNGLLLATAKGIEKLDATGPSPYEQEDFYFLDCLTHNKPFSRCKPESSLQSTKCVLRESRQIMEATK